MCHFVHCFHLETQSHLALMCSLTQLTCMSQLWPSTTTQSSVHTHTDYFASRESRRWSGCDPCPHPCPSPLSIFPRGFSLSLCVSHNIAKILQTTFVLVLRLVDLVLVSGILCLLHHPINFGLRQFPFHRDTLTDRGLDAIVCGL